MTEKTKIIIAYLISGGLIALVDYGFISSLGGMIEQNPTWVVVAVMSFIIIVNLLFILKFTLDFGNTE